MFWKLDITVDECYNICQITDAFLGILSEQKFVVIHCLLCSYQSLFTPKGGFQMRYVDLHVHSNDSDGTLSPTEVVQLARKKIWLPLHCQTMTQ